MKADCLPD